ncbi:MAG: hypothetical protein ACREUP_09615 [Burkholderiales bacterium]
MTRRLLAVLLLAVFVWITATLTPHFLRNLRLQQYMENLTQARPGDAAPESVRGQVVERARQLGIPMTEADVQVGKSEAAMRISARYLVEVNLPGYTVKLHFAPSGGR